MRLIILAFLLCILCSSVAIAATVNRVMPSTVEPGSTFKVTFKISSAKAGETFTLEETRPLQVEITDWEVDGAQETKDKVQVRVKDLGFGWSFTAQHPDPKITYTAKVSEKATGPLDFEAVYFDSSGFNKVPGQFTVGRAESTSKTNAPSKATNPLEVSSAKATPEPPSTPTGAAYTGGVPGQAGKVFTGILIILAIIGTGLGVFHVLTRPKKPKSPFDDKFFQKK